MNNYTVEVKPPARKELEALPDNVLARVVRKLEALGHAHWRVVYIIDDATEVVSVTRIAHRSEVYE